MVIDLINQLTDIPPSDSCQQQFCVKCGMSSLSFYSMDRQKMPGWLPRLQMVPELHYASADLEITQDFTCFFSRAEDWFDSFKLADPVVVLSAIVIKTNRASEYGIHFYTFSIMLWMKYLLLHNEDILTKPSLSQHTSRSYFLHFNWGIFLLISTK